MSLADDLSEQQGAQPPAKKKPAAAPVDTVRLKKDLGTYGDQAVKYGADLLGGTGNFWKDAKTDVARGDSLQNARDGRIPANAGDAKAQQARLAGALKRKTP